MNEANAREVLSVWNNNYFAGRLKTNQVSEAERVIESTIITAPASPEKLKELSRKQTELIREINNSTEFNTHEKTYLIKLHKEIKSFYDRYYKRQVKKK